LLPTPRQLHLQSSASDDLQSPEKIRSLLKDLREARQAKCRDGLQKLDHSELSVCPLLPSSCFQHANTPQLPNLCSMEITEIRPFFIRAMSVLTQLARAPVGELGGAPDE
jgi:GINS complex subunit 2